jgi:hypothetical protein
MRSPDDTPLRDGNRDRLMGLLTDRAAKLLAGDVSESNPALHTWMVMYLNENKIPKVGGHATWSGAGVGAAGCLPWGMYRSDFWGRPHHTALPRAVCRAPPRPALPCPVCLVPPRPALPCLALPCPALQHTPCNTRPAPCPAPLRCSPPPCRTATGATSPVRTSCAPC